MQQPPVELVLVAYLIHVFSAITTTESYTGRRVKVVFPAWTTESVSSISYTRPVSKSTQAGFSNFVRVR